MTTCERIKRMFEHKEADRVPIIDSPWFTTIERWRREGLPKDVHFADYFGIDQVMSVGMDNSPRYEEETIEENDQYKIYTTKWGATLKSWKHATSTPEFVDFTIKSADDWRLAKRRMTPTRDRVDWDYLQANYRNWRAQGRWIQVGLWFGFDVTHSWMVGTERVLIALVENPQWMKDMFNHCLSMNLALLNMMWDDGYRFDSIFWPDDMGYKQNQFFSVQMYRDILKPVHKRAVEWAHTHGIKAHLHSCGDINPLVPELIDIGLDALNPLEVKAGMDTLELKKKYGDKLVLHGGINAVLWDKPDQIRAEIEQKLPGLKEKGGYIFSSDHSVPDSVGLEDFRGIVELAKKLGSY
jgi:uroporphyrinogen decarboxylase